VCVVHVKLLATRGVAEAGPAYLSIRFEAVTLITPCDTDHTLSGPGVRSPGHVWLGYLAEKLKPIRPKGSTHDHPIARIAYPDGRSG
jgi:hypothetical protein